jgi:hypothetical protein
MSELDISTLNPGDAVGWTFQRSGWTGARGVKATTVARLTRTQVITEDGFRFYREGRHAGSQVGGSPHYPLSMLVSLDCPDAIASRAYKEFQRLHDALAELRKVKAPTSPEGLRDHLAMVERVVADARARLDGSAP